ncbi:MAG: archaemetzincin family Zn-dependent metalloprotease [Nitrospirae bacterium]|nr:archaemetzincin family Zn-dependent metalloprotease [Nitrospirota bacterium]
MLKKILIIPIGDIDQYILHSISQKLEKTFHDKLEIGKKIQLPQDSYDSDRKQYNSSIILQNIKPIKPTNVDLILGITDVDLFVPELNFVFGEADVSSGITIISLLRLKPEFYGETPDMKLFLERAEKEAIHELGHAYWLGHCTNPNCIMYFSNTIYDTDIKGSGFCRKCRRLLGYF